MKQGAAVRDGLLRTVQTDDILFCNINVAKVLRPPFGKRSFYMLAMFTDIVSGLVVYPQRMLENMEITRGVVFSQRVLLALVEKGMSRHGVRPEYC